MISSDQLKQFGLSEKEAKVYLAALELGSDSVQNISKKAKIHRVSTYDILESLKNKGFTTESVKGQRRYITAIEPESILDALKSKEVLFADLLPQLKAVQDKGKSKPKVIYFEGKDGVWQAHMDRIRHQTELKENLVYGSSEKIRTIFADEFKRFTKERLAKGIKAKTILEKSSSGQWEAKTAKDQLREVKFLPNDKRFTSTTVIYGDRVLAISWESMIAVIIEDKNYAENQRLVFNLLWEYLP